MGTNSAIEWCHHTGNLWWGCVEVHEGCDHCYARTFDKRVGGKHWGARQPRRAIASVWDNFAKWQRKAAELGEVHRVFVGSMMDIFERDRPCVDYHGQPLDVTTDELRQRFFTEVVPSCPNLHFLLLTKRPRNITKMVPAAWLDSPPANVMYGTSVVNQETADRDVPALLKVPGKRFLSMEPLLGSVDLKSWLHGIDWVIVGGESSHHARPMHPDWARHLRYQCVAAGVPYFFKQWGERLHKSQFEYYGYKKFLTADPDVEWLNVGKKHAGRLLDGRTWDEFPSMEITS